VLNWCGVSDGAAAVIVTRADMAKSIGGARSFFDEKIKLQHLGVKTSKGIYDYGGHRVRDPQKTKHPFSGNDGMFGKDQCLGAGVNDNCS
jgi:3-hydroxyacyl-CoA dehydrogenase